MEKNERESEYKKTYEFIAEQNKLSMNKVEPFNLSHLTMFKNLEELANAMKDGEMSYKEQDNELLKTDAFEELANCMYRIGPNNLFKHGEYSNPGGYDTLLRYYVKNDISKYYEELSDSLNEWLIPDVYYNINYICDFLINCRYEDYFDTLSLDSYIENPQTIWYEQDKDLQNDLDNEIEHRFCLGYDKIKDYIANLICYENKNLYVAKICPNLGLYIYKNIRKLPWYDQKYKKENQVCLLTNFTDAEGYNFTDSEYFIFEKMLNLNSALKLTEYIIENKVFSIYEAKMLNENKNSAIGNFTFENHKMMIKNIISQISSPYAPILYSNSKILEWIFNRIEILENESEIGFDIDTRFNLIKAYYALLAIMAENRINSEINNSFYRQISNPDKIDISDMKKIKDVNCQKFKEEYLNEINTSDNAQVFGYNKLIKYRDKYKISSENRVATLNAYINTFVQKEFLGKYN